MIEGLVVSWVLYLKLQRQKMWQRAIKDDMAARSSIERCHRLYEVSHGRSYPGCYTFSTRSRRGFRMK